MTAALSPELNAELQKTDSSELVDVVLELQRQKTPDEASPERSRSERIAALKESFDQEVEPVEELVRRIGGEVTGRAWINQTIRVRLPAQRIEELAAHEKIRAVDLPHAITPDLG